MAVSAAAAGSHRDADAVCTNSTPCNSSPNARPAQHRRDSAEKQPTAMILPCGAQRHAFSSGHALTRRRVSTAQRCAWATHHRPCTASAVADASSTSYAPALELQQLLAVAKEAAQAGAQVSMRAGRAMQVHGRHGRC